MKGDTITTEVSEEGGDGSPPLKESVHVNQKMATKGDAMATEVSEEGGDCSPPLKKSVHVNQKTVMIGEVRSSLVLPDPRHQPVIAYSMNARRERVWDTTVPRFVLAPPELGWAIIG